MNVIDAALPEVALLKAMASGPFETARAMPKEVYTSAAFCALEVERIFRREWICVGRAEQLAEPGAYIAYDLAGQPVFVIRDEAGALRAFSNVCLHRMSTLLEGTGCARRVRCPYHGWTYDLDGRLRSAATMKANAGFDAAAYRLPELRCETWLGWIMVSLNPDAPPVAEALAGLTAEIADYAPEAYIQSFYETFEWDTNWKVLAENFMESYHLHVCHAGTIGPATDLAQMNTPPGAAAYNFHTLQKAADAPLTNAHPASTRLSGDRRRTTYIIAVYPSLMITLTPGYFWYLSLHPKGPGRVHVTYAGGLSPDYARDAEAQAHFRNAKALLDRVNMEDKGCVERVYRGLSADLAEAGHMSPLERPLYDFAGYLAGRM